MVSFPMRSVELFAGAGGLAIGMANAGFHHDAVIERDHYACETFRQNQHHHVKVVDAWPVHEVDARDFDYKLIAPGISVVSGGPPCQPFSMGGKHQAQQDERNMFPEAIRAIRELTPDAFIFENVKGLTRASFSQYLSYIKLQLQFPDYIANLHEDWYAHFARLELLAAGGGIEPTYDVWAQTLNAADYGVPQKRERIFFVGFKRVLNVDWAFPAPTHSQDALFVSKWITGEYWLRHSIKPSEKLIPERFRSRFERLIKKADNINILPWKTVRDVISDLPDPEIMVCSSIPNHIYVPGARRYVGHTGSSLDEPSKTLKAGYHGVPGGENMLIKDDGSVRYFTVREAARLQTFPDHYEFHGAWGQAMRQLGNAVPVKLAEIIASCVSIHLR